MQNLKKVLWLTIALVLCLAMAACNQTTTPSQSADNNKTGESNTDNGNASDGQKQKISLGSLGASIDMLDWIKEAFADKYDIEVISFTENQMPATALKDGEIDGFINNQLLWLNSFNSTNGCDLRMLEPYIYYPGYGAYSLKHDSIDAIPQNGQVAMPSDPSNMERCLLVMEGMGLITLGEKREEFYTILDIKDNPKNLGIVETEITATARSLPDVDLVIVTSNSIKEAGYDPSDVLFEDPQAKNFPIGLVVHPDNVDAQWAKDIVSYCRGEDFRTLFNNYFQGTRILFD